MERKNLEKYRLIEMVHKRPILWDSSLPNFKGAEQDKSAAWAEISKEFNLTPQRAERSFKSLRESYRRELATQKQLGDAFKPKWEYFLAMDFLRSVIRERKANSSFDQRDYDMPLSQLDEFAYYVQHHDNVVPTVTSTSHRRNSSSTASGDNITTTMREMPVKKEEHHFDDDEEVEELSPIDEDYPFPDIQLVSEHAPPLKKIHRRSLPINNNQPPKRKRNSDEMLVTSNQNHNEKQIPSSPPPSPSPPTFINERAEFHDRFGNFVAAKLNTLKDNDANELMSKIFMLLFKH